MFETTQSLFVLGSLLIATGFSQASFADACGEKTLLLAKEFTANVHKIAKQKGTTSSIKATGVVVEKAKGIYATILEQDDAKFAMFVQGNISYGLFWRKICNVTRLGLFEIDENGKPIRALIDQKF